MTIYTGALSRGVKCFKCLQSGHYAEECRQPTVCKRCRGTGHHAEVCEGELWREPQQQQRTMPLTVASCVMLAPKSILLPGDDDDDDY